MACFSNSFACLKHHKTSLKGTVKDYVFNFNLVEYHLESIVQKTATLLHQLIDSYDGKHLLGRLIAKVNFVHINPMTNEEELRPYHFASYKSEKIEDVDEFYVSHMKKIASRLDTFTSNGSNLVIRNIEHIHIQLSVVS